MPNTPLLTFESLASAFQNYILSDPVTSMQTGATTHLSTLGDPSLDNMLARNQSAKSLLAQFEACTTDLDFDQTLDLDLMARHLKQSIFFNELKQQGIYQRCRKPSGIDGISEGIFQLFINDERTAELRLNDILSRLYQAPGYLRIERDVITQPVKRWRDIELDQGHALPDLFNTIYQWAEDTGYSKLSSLKSAILDCNNAITDYLSDLEKRDCITTFTIGEDNVKTLLTLRNIKQSPRELIAMARDFATRTQSLLKELNTRLCKKYGLPENTTDSDLHDFLNQQFAVPVEGKNLQTILDNYSGEMAAINRFCTEEQRFNLPDQQAIRLMQTPGFLEPVIPAGAMLPPLALRPGCKTSLVYLTLKADQLSEHTQLGIPLMMIHEGIPGHHLQFATAAQHPSFIRRIFSANEHAEGWTTMLEDYMLDIGYIDESLVDEVRFTSKRDISRLIARVGIDLYFMTGDRDYLDVGYDLDFATTGYSDDMFENAARLLKKATGFSDGRVQSELNWYSQQQGYPLSYLTGNYLVWQLKNDIQSSNRKNLDNLALDRAFHDIYLSSGCMPVESLRTVFEHKGFL